MSRSSLGIHVDPFPPLDKDRERSCSPKHQESSGAEDLCGGPEGLIGRFSGYEAMSSRELGKNVPSSMT
jgi:hypothetical protein